MVFTLSDADIPALIYVAPHNRVTFARQQTLFRRLEQNVPPEGSVRAIFVTRAQWERAYSIMGKPAKEVATEKILVQLQFW